MKPKQKRKRKCTALPRKCKRCERDQVSYGRALVTLKGILMSSQSIKFMYTHGVIGIDECFEDIHFNANQLDIILSLRHLKHEIKCVQALEPSDKCTTPKKMLDMVGYCLKTDINEFYRIFATTAGNVFHDMKMALKWRNINHLEMYKILMGFWSNIRDVHESWDELYMRLKDLKEMIQPTGKKVEIPEDRIGEINDIYTSSRIEDPSELSTQETRQRVYEVRKNNRKIHRILRETDFELTEEQLDRLKEIKKKAKGGHKKASTSVTPMLKKFEGQLAVFSLKTKNFRVDSIKMCLESEKVLMNYLAVENIFKPDFTDDASICNKLADFFETILVKYKTYTSEMDVLKVKLNDQWNYYK